MVGKQAGEPERSVSPDGETVVRTDYLNVGHHVVQFYGHDDKRAERVTGYLLGALEGGGVAISRSARCPAGAPGTSPTTPPWW
jgi:hypothetical protein